MHTAGSRQHLAKCDWWSWYKPTYCVFVVHSLENLYPVITPLQIRYFNVSQFSSEWVSCSFMKNSVHSFRCNQENKWNIKNRREWREKKWLQLNHIQESTIKCSVEICAVLSVPWINYYWFLQKSEQKKNEWREKKDFACKSIVELTLEVQLLVYQVCIVSTLYFCILYKLEYRMAGIENES